MDIIQLIMTNPWIALGLKGLGLLVVVGSAWIAITPTQADDAWYARMEAIPFIGQALRFLGAFAPIQRKP